MQPTRIVKETCTNIKEIALKSLQGKWRIAILGFLLVSVLSIIPSIALPMIFGNTVPIKGLQFIYNLLVNGPLSLGFASLSLHLLRREPVSPVEVVYGFERFGKAFGVNCLIMIIGTVMGGIGAALILLCQGFGLRILILLVIAAITIWIQLHLMLSYYILHDQHQMNVIKILKESCRMMKGNKWKAFLLGLSFIGWIILEVIFLMAAAAVSKVVLPLIMLIPMIFLTVYVNQSMAAFYELIRGDSAIAIEVAEERKQLESL